MSRYALPVATAITMAFGLACALPVSWATPVRLTCELAVAVIVWRYYYVQSKQKGA